MIAKAPEGSLTMEVIARTAALAGLLALVAASALAQSGIVGQPQELPPITLSSGQPLAAAPLELKSGTYYELVIQADGSAEMAISGAEFFRNTWIDEIVINSIEIRPLGLDSIEFDDAGEAEISFIPIKLGTFELRARGVEPLQITVVE
jgi:DNA-binding protein